jgi:hypothetical protein
MYTRPMLIGIRISNQYRAVKFLSKLANHFNVPEKSASYIRRLQPCVIKQSSASYAKRTSALRVKKPSALFLYGGGTVHNGHKIDGLPRFLSSLISLSLCAATSYVIVERADRHHGRPIVHGCEHIDATCYSTGFGTRLAAAVGPSTCTSSAGLI